MKITQYKALGFSCYGTLVDRDGGVLEGLRSFWAHSQPEELLNAYQRLSTRLRREAPEASHRALNGRVYVQLAQDLHLQPDWDESYTFGNTAGQWPVFEDVPGALQYLSKFYRLLLVSPFDMGDASALAERLPVTFDAILENRGNDLRAALDAALAPLGLDRAELLPVRSPEPDDPWEGVVDFPVCTLRRRHQRPWQQAAQAIDVKRCEYASLADLVHAHQAALRS